MPLECKFTGAVRGGTKMERNQEETGETRDNENTEEREEMHCMGSRKWKAKGGNVKGRKVGLRIEKKGFNNNHIQIMRYLISQWTPQ